MTKSIFAFTLLLCLLITTALHAQYVVDSTNSNLVSNQVTDFVQTYGWNNWRSFLVAHEGQGVSNSVGPPIHYTRANSGLPSDTVYRLAHNWQSGIIYFGTAAGFAFLDSNNTWTVFDTSNSPLPDNHIQYFQHHDNYDEVWLCTQKGVARYVQGGWTIYDSTNQGIVSDNIIGYRRIQSGSTTSDWLITPNGVSRLRNGVWAHFPMGNMGLPNSTIISFNEYQFGWDTLLLGTSTAGYVLVTGASFQVFDSSVTNLPTNRITTMLYDYPQGHGGPVLMIGTDQGLFESDFAGSPAIPAWGSTVPSVKITRLLYGDFPGDSTFGSWAQGVWVGTEDAGIYGKRTFVGVEAAALATDLKLWPNPADQVLRMSSSREWSAYTVRDVLGREILRGNFSSGGLASIVGGEEQLKVGDLPNGTYILTVTDPVGESGQVRFCVQH